MPKVTQIAKLGGDLSGGKSTLGGMAGWMHLTVNNRNLQQANKSIKTWCREF